MEDADCRRVRKPINYAEFADTNLNEDDFDDDFRTSSKSKKEKSNDKTERVNGEERKDDKERKHSRDKHREHKKHKDKDRDRHKRDKDRHRERHRKEDDERKDNHRSKHDSKRKEHEMERRHRSERRDEKFTDDSCKSEGNSDTKYDSSGSQGIIDSSTTSTTTTASPLVSPSRRNPKPRLSLEEKMFQRELEVALEISKADAAYSSANTPETKEQTKQDEGAVLDVQTSLSLKSCEGDSAVGSCSLPSQNSKATENASSSTPDKVCSPEKLQDEKKLPDPPTAAAAAVTQLLPPPPRSPSIVQSNDLMEPQPSTSTGLGVKRARKTVNFKEDSDSSDSFDGFGYISADSDASEGSDFMPSPKKKKKQKSKDPKKTTKASKQTKPNVCKSSVKTPKKNTPTRQVSSPPIHSQCAKENNVPRSPINTLPPPARSTEASSRVSVSPQSKVSSKLLKVSPTKASTTKNTSNIVKPMKRPSINTPPSPSSGTSITLVKTPFRSPLTTSPGSGHPINSSASSVDPKGHMPRGTGLRLGLSRRAIIKPLHPSVATKLMD